jgi:uncharacterized protein (UPF0276 family)
MSASAAELPRIQPVGGPIPVRAGIGLRLPHHEHLMNAQPDIAWLEVHPENYMTGASHAHELDWISQHYPISFHAVGLSLGSIQRPQHHTARLAVLIKRYQPALVSDHLSWSSVDGKFWPDLLPLPYTEEALCVFARNVDFVQNTLARQILIENPSRYVRLADATMSESEFLSELVRRCDCGILLDINNIYVAARNLGENPREQLSKLLNLLPPESVHEIHLAGHATDTFGDGRPLLVDDHGATVCDEVWQMYRSAIGILSARPTLIEWDTRLPDFHVLEVQARIAQDMLDQSDDRFETDVAS